MAKVPVTLSVNGETYELEIQPHRLLLDVLREDLRLTGTKESCREGECGSCTVLLDGAPINSCLFLAIAAQGKEITTVEGLAKDGCLDPVQAGFARSGGVQCGFCTPGFIMSARALLNENPNPTEAEIRAYLAGNICRCTGYNHIVDAVLLAARAERGEE